MDRRIIPLEPAISGGRLSAFNLLYRAVYVCACQKGPKKIVGLLRSPPHFLLLSLLKISSSPNSRSSLFFMVDPSGIRPPPSSPLLLFYGTAGAFAPPSSPYSTAPRGLPMVLPARSRLPPLLTRSFPLLVGHISCHEPSPLRGRGGHRILGEVRKPKTRNSP